MEWKIRDKDNTMGWGGGRRGVKKRLQLFVVMNKTEP